MSGAINLNRYSKDQIRDALWRQGSLRWQFHSGQKELSDLFHTAKGRKWVANCSRRWGKSFWMCVEAVQMALLKPRAQIRYAAPTAKMVRLIIDRHLADILATCPKDLRPKHSSQDGIYHFPHNGSEIHVSGCDNQGSERLRGVATDLALIDEAGLIDDLEYLVQDILLPQTLTTDGRIVMASTPPKTPGHSFHRYFIDAMLQGQGVHKTIYDAPHIKPERIEEFIRESGGEHTSTWRREYLAEFVVDDNLAVVPEFSKANIVDDYPFPTFADCYVAMDVGYSDLTVAVFAVYDFITATLYIIDEYVTSQSTSDVIDKGVEFTEKRAFEGRPVYKRTCDAPQIVLADIRRRAGRSWNAARKDDADAALNALRLRVQRGQLLVHSRCKVTIAHLQNAIWNKAKTTFERSGEYGHFDAVDACKYLVRHVDWDRNPNPKTHFDPQEYLVRREREEEDDLSRLVRPGFRRR